MKTPSKDTINEPPKVWRTPEEDEPDIQLISQEQYNEKPQHLGLSHIT